MIAIEKRPEKYSAVQWNGENGRAYDVRNLIMNYTSCMVGSLAIGVDRPNLHVMLMLRNDEKKEIVLRKSEWAVVRIAMDGKYQDEPLILQDREMRGLFRVYRNGPLVDDNRDNT